MKVIEKNRVLFIEDEKELLASVSQLLRDHDYVVTAVSDAEEALRQLKKSEVDLIIADIKLPGIDGFDFFHEVRKDPRHASVPVVFVTAFNSVQAMMYAKSIGAAEYITKPFDFEYLLARVDMHVGRTPRH